MILRLEMPFIDRSVRRGRIVAWHKAEGDRVIYGDGLCDIGVEEVTRVAREVHAGKLASRAAGGAGGRGAADYRTEDEIGYVVRIIASDTGYVRRILALEGQLRNIGDLLAVLSTDESEPGALSEPSPASPLFRVVANTVHADEEE